MSMDRYFTLKYPMRYGRNKTKKMVLLKIFFVWAVSIAVSSPVCIHGFIDTSIVYSHGQCVPTLKTFVIYGSVFAFYIPLIIMIVTYVLTIQILLKNQRMMKRIERSDFRSRFDPVKAFPNLNIPQLLTPPSGESSAVSFNETNNDSPLHLSSDTIVKSSTKLCETPETENDSNDNLNQSSIKLLKQNSYSYKSLQVREDDMLYRHSQQSLYDPQNTHINGYTSLNRDNKKHRKQKKHFLEVPNESFFQKNYTLSSAKSDSSVPKACFNDHKCMNKMSLHLSFNHLDHDSKSSEWNRRFIQIQQEMDQCLQDSERENTDKKRKTELKLVDDFLKYSMHPMCHSAPSSPLRGGSRSNCDIDCEDKSTSSNESDLITIRLHSRANNPCSTSKENCLSNGTVNNGLNEHNKEVDNISKSTHPLCTDIDEELNASDNENPRFKRNGSKFKARFRATIKAKTRPVIRHLLSKKAATNERKASKVLGIIFIVFVILWSPFFIVNILSVTCRMCMSDVTAKLMSVILWMGYAASLANPIIYTMFNTAFRRTFIKILTCKIQRRRSKYADTALHSYTTMMQTERRNTMTVLIKDDSR
ncbi:hypothetical protein SNE40_001217 [Patella caerulea]|uniref:G-protein coupled receptors family 1 profile domain-containing protein n=1 Tax=Patella caerulea TaxID=87958 RepID=A0AAN8Q2P0_PATCE